MAKRKKWWNSTATRTCRCGKKYRAHKHEAVYYDKHRCDECSLSNQMRRAEKHLAELKRRLVKQEARQAKGG